LRDSFAILHGAGGAFLVEAFEFWGGEDAGEGGSV